MKFSLEWLSDHVDVGAAGGADGVRRLLAQAGLPAESAASAGDDTVLDVEITPNRPDAMGHRGLAREVAAMAGVPLNAAAAAEPPSAGESVERVTSVVIQVPRQCRRFGVRLLRGIRNGAAPARVRARLERLGAHAISSAVDATNYGLWDTGQPLHAFDFDKLAGGLVIVRRAFKGEKLVTLDGVERELAPGDVVVADAERAVSLAGIMGGLETAVTGETRNVLLEGAWWDPVSIRRTARRLGLHTDASHRFERGADLDAIPGALKLAANLILEASGGTLAPGLLDARGAPFRVRRATLRLAKLRALGGDDRVTLEFAEEALRRLEFAPERRGKHVAVAIPLFRQDVRREEDLVEEVLRVWGYDRLPSRLPPSSQGPGSVLEPQRRVEERATDAAAAAGLFETVSFPFADPEEEKPFAAWLAVSEGSGKPLAVTNPLDDRRGHLRRTLLPGILDALSRNVRRGAETAGLFEVGRAFGHSGDPAAPESFEDRRLAFALCGEARRHWSDPPARRTADFFDAKGVVARVLAPFADAAAFDWRPFEDPAFARGAAALLVSPAGAVAGVVGAVSDAEREKRRLPAAAFAGELLIGALPADGSRAAFRPYSAFPPVPADLSFAQPRDLAWATLRRFVEERKPPTLESVRLLDRFEPPGVAPDRVKTTLRLTFRAADRTLEQEEVNGEVRRLADALRDELGVEL